MFGRKWINPSHWVGRLYWVINRLHRCAGASSDSPARPPAFRGLCGAARMGRDTAQGDGSLRVPVGTTFPRGCSRGAAPWLREGACVPDVPHQTHHLFPLDRSGATIDSLSLSLEEPNPEVLLYQNILNCLICNLNTYH